MKSPRTLGNVIYVDFKGKKRKKPDTQTVNVFVDSPIATYFIVWASKLVMDELSIMAKKGQSLTSMLVEYDALDKFDKLQEDRSLTAVIKYRMKDQLRKFIQDGECLDSLIKETHRLYDER